MPGQTMVTHSDAATFQGGLRAFFEYRDTGVREATGERFGAHVIRAVPGEGAKPNWHAHDLDFQMVYILRGWVEFEYEDVGFVRLEPGATVLQPPGVRHRELRHSDDLELLEITSPAEFVTRVVDAPARAA